MRLQLNQIIALLKLLTFLFMYYYTVFVPFKYSKVRGKKEIDSVDQMQKKIVRVTAVESSFQNKHHSAAAHHSSICCDEKRFVHRVQESLPSDDRSSIDQNTAVRIGRICCRS